MKNFFKKKKRTEIARYLPIEGESWVNTYFLEVKNAFFRAWNWKFMWFWTFFLVGGVFNVINVLVKIIFNNNNDNQVMPLYLLTGDVFTKYSYVLVAIFIIFILCMLIFVVISYVANWGVTRSISEIQDIGKPENDSFKEIWRKGGGGVVKLFVFNIVVFLIFTSFFVVCVIPFIFLGIKSWFLHVYIVFIIPALFLFALMFYYISQISIIILILENSTPIKSIKKALRIIRYSYKEVAKLIIVRWLLDVFIGIISFLYILMCAVIIYIAALVFNFVIDNEITYLSEIIKIIIILIDAVLVIGVLISIIIFKLISKLVHMDLWIWWIKRNIPSLRQKN